MIGNTPKYGLIFHSSFIGRAGTKNKGRISRYLANKCSIASRIDCFMETSTNIFGTKLVTLSFEFLLETFLSDFHFGVCRRLLTFFLRTQHYNPLSFKWAMEIAGTQKLATLISVFK